MPANVSQHTFVKGLVSDLELGMRNQESYEYAENFRHTSDESASIGSIINIKGFEKQTADLDIDSRLTLVSYCVIRDNLYLLLTSRPSAGGSDTIIRFDIDAENKSISNQAMLYGGGGLGLNISHNTDCVGVYESVDNIKIYWATEGQNLKVANVSTYLTSNGLPKSGGNTWLSSDRFDIMTSITLNPITINEIVSGSLESGRIQYAYSLVKTNIQESAVSPLSLPINLFSDSLSAPSTVNIKGDKEVVNTGKGISLTIATSTPDRAYFDKIRLYRIHYTEYGQVPQIIIVGDFAISNSANTSIIDAGQVGLGEMTAEEFSILSTLIQGKTLAVKDNRLFVGNVSESNFDIDTDYDARAYRFRPDQVCFLYSTYGSPAVINYAIDGTNPSVAHSSFSSWNDVIPEAPCLNRYNDLSFDLVANNDFKYQTDGTTEGGEGPNIKYTFVVNSTIKLDGTATYANAQTYSSDTSATYDTLDYTSPKLTKLYTGYQRGEVYRFGIIFYNSLGQKSKVKWIGDVRFPTYSATSAYDTITNPAGSEVLVYAIGMSVTLKTGLPTGAVKWELVRVKRTTTDRTVVTSGMLSATYDDTTNGTMTTRLGIPGAVQAAFPDSSLNLQLVSLFSPDEIYQGHSDIKIGDFVDLVGTLQAYVTYASSGGTYPSITSSTGKKNSIKYRSASLFGSAVTKYRYTIENNGFYGSSNNPVQYYSYTSAVSNTFTQLSFLNTNLSSDFMVSQQSGSCSILQLDSSMSAAITALSFANYEVPYVQVKRNNTSRYGGYLYENREINEYIPCGNITSSVTNVAYYGGDTYINYFDYLNAIYSDYSFINNAAEDSIITFEKSYISLIIK